MIEYGNKEGGTLYLYYTGFNERAQIETASDEIVEPVGSYNKWYAGVFYQSKTSAYSNKLFS